MRIPLKIEAAIENRIIEEPFRPHLGGSIIGSKCKRQIWYSFRWALKRLITPQQKRLFNRGHMEEIVVIEDLINAGCEVKGINIDESIRARFKTVLGIDLPEQKQFSNKFAFDHGSGSCDSIIYNLPDSKQQPHLFECKTSATKYFKIMVEKGLKLAVFKYFVQCQIYMHIFKLKRCLFVMVNKETDERYYERFKYDKKIALEYIRIGEEIIKSESPPQRLSEDSNFYMCGEKWCVYREICHFNSLPIKNCRTCENFGLRDKGIILCELKKKELEYKKQVKGCKHYKLNEVFK